METESTFPKRNFVSSEVICEGLLNLLNILLSELDKTKYVFLTIFTDCFDKDLPSAYMKPPEQRSRKFAFKTALQHANTELVKLNSIEFPVNFLVFEESKSRRNFTVQPNLSVKSYQVNNHFMEN